MSRERGTEKTDKPITNRKKHVYDTYKNRCKACENLYKTCKHLHETYGMRYKTYTNLYNNYIYAQALIVVVLMVVTLVGFLAITRNQ